MLNTLITIIAIGEIPDTGTVQTPKPQAELTNAAVPVDAAIPTVPPIALPNLVTTRFVAILNCR